MLQDLGSRNGCFVNGRPVTTHVLADGDQIRMGDSALLFTGPESAGAPPPKPPAPALDDTPVPDAATVAIPAGETRYCRLGRGDITLPESERASRDLAVLLRLSDGLQRALSRDAVCAALVAHASEAVRADWVAVLTSGEPGAVQVSAASPGCDRALTISHTIASRAMNDRVAVMANDLHADSRFAEAASVAGSPDRAVMCAPLLAPDNVTGAVYVARSTEGAPFSEDDLQVVGGDRRRSAGLPSIGVRHLEWLDRRERATPAGRRDRARPDRRERARCRPSSASSHASAPTDATVLIRGESGTGKELVATRHSRQQRARAAARSSPSTAPPCPKRCSRASCSATSAAPSPARSRSSGAGSELAERGHGVPRRDRRAAAAAAGQAAARAAGRTVERVGGRGADPDRRARDRRDQPRPRRGHPRAARSARTCTTGSTWCRSTVPPLRERREDIAAAGGLLRPQARGAMQARRSRAFRPRRAAADARTTGRATCASWRTPSSARWCSARLMSSCPEDLPDALLDQPAADSSGEGFHERVAAHKRAVIQRGPRAKRRQRRAGRPRCWDCSRPTCTG